MSCDVTGVSVTLTFPTLLQAQTALAVLSEIDVSAVAQTAESPETAASTTTSSNSTAAAEPTKRTRRTKAEMEAARAAEATGGAASSPATDEAFDPFADEPPAEAVKDTRSRADLTVALREASSTDRAWLVSEMEKLGVARVPLLTDDQIRAILATKGL